MSEENLRRRLAAIMSADVKDYSRLMRENEAATVQTLKSYKETMAMLVTQYHGRVVDSPGDNMLAEFASVVDAVQSAVAIQKDLKLHNARLEEGRRMEFRIGINLGDIIADGDRIYGDGVNIAARLEGLAEPGGICISRTAYDQIEDKLPFGYEYLGEKSVKNIGRPVPAYKVLLEPEESKGFVREDREPDRTEAAEPAEDVPAQEVSERYDRRKAGFWGHLRVFIGVIGFLFVIDLITGDGWWFYWPALPWGLGLFFHWSSAYGFPRRRSPASIRRRRQAHKDLRDLKKSIRSQVRGDMQDLGQSIRERVRGEEGGLKYLRVQVEPKGEGGRRQGRVNIRVPLSLLRAGVKLSTVLPEHAKDKINAALRAKGMDLDISSLEGEKLEELLASLSDMGIDVDEKDKTVRIFFE
jgi:class 3 adenylate cyclase